MEKCFEKWNDKEYLVRVIPFPEELGYGSPIKVASSLLWDAISDAYDKSDGKAVGIDNGIFCYVEPKFIDSGPTDKELADYVIKKIVF